MINREQVYKKYSGRCAYCGKEIKFKDMQVDHQIALSNIKPISKDVFGKYIYPDKNDLSNLMPACRRCNHYKSACTLEIFRNLIKTIHERIHDKYIVKVAEDYGILQYKKWDGLFYFEKFAK